MKKRYLAMALGLMIAVSQVSVYAEEGTNEVQTEMTDAQDGTSDSVGSDEAAETVTGQITEIGSDSITVSVGMGQSQMPGAGEQPQGAGAGAEGEPQGDEIAAGSEHQGDGAGAEEEHQGDGTGTEDEHQGDGAGAEGEHQGDGTGAEGEHQGDGTGTEDEPQGNEADAEVQSQGDIPEQMEASASETVTIQITDATQILKQSTGMQGGGQAMGEMPEKPDGEASDGQQGSEVPEKPDGDTSDGEASEAPSGDANGEVPEKPDGDTSDGEASEAPSGDANGEAPEKPDGDASDGEASEAPSGDANGEAPEKPDGDTSAGEAPEMPSGDMTGEAPDGSAGQDMGGQPGGDLSATETITLSDLEVGDMVTVVLNEDGSAAIITVQSMGQGAGGMASGNGGMGGGMGQSGVDSYDAVQTISEDTELDGETITSTGTDENAVLIDSDVTASLSDMTIIRESSDSTGGDNSSFYGVGAAVLATDGTVYVDDSTITTDASGGAGIFAYGDSTVYVSDTDITTQQDTSGGIHAAGGGTLYAWDVTAETNGRSAAAVRSDRGGGLMVVDGGTYTSNGPDSPAVYCTADISINDAELTANSSEAVCIEGLNTLRLYDCDLTGTMSEDDRNDNTWTVIVYQSMSGDSEVGNGTFQMVDGTLTAAGSGGLFYTTNTECTITLKDVDIVKSDESTFFLQCTGNTNSRGWGQTGRNGSDCLFTAISQEMQGDVIWDSISNLEFYMTDGSILTGAFVDDETYAGEGGDGVCNVYISEDSTWIVTGDSTVSVLNSEGIIVDEDGNTVTVQGEDGTVYVEGDSEYTITVDDYSDSVNLSGSSHVDNWEDHAVEMPEEI